MLSLHLLRLSLVYVNTFLIQQVLAEPAWSGRLTVEDRSAITPMLYAHVNPNGSFRLDLHAPCPPTRPHRPAKSSW